MKSLAFRNLKGYQLNWLKSDLIAALIVTAIAIPESLGFAVIVGLPVQTGLYCALIAPIVFAAFTSSKRLVVGADSATAALVAAGAATVAVAGTAAYGNAILVLGLLTAAVLLVMSAARFGFMADLISRPVLIGFISGVGIQLIIGKLPEMMGHPVSGGLFEKLQYIGSHLTGVQWATAALSLTVVAIVLLGWKYRWPGAVVALALATLAAKLFGLHAYGIVMVGAVPAGLPSLRLPSLNLHLIVDLIPAAFSIALVILAQSLAVIRNSASRHEEPVKDNQDLAALGLANAASALIGGFAINGSPPRTSASEMAGGRSQLVNVMMALFVGAVLIFATGLFEYVPAACLAAIVFAIGLHLVKVSELREIYAMRRSEFAVAMAALGGVAVLGVQRGVIIAVIISLMERLRREYHPTDEILLRDQVYTQWAIDRFGPGEHELDAPAGLLAYRFNDAIFFENSGYFLSRVQRVIAEADAPVKWFVLDASAINDIDFTAGQVLTRLVHILDADDTQLVLAHVSPRLRQILNRYALNELIGSEHLFPSLRFAIEAYESKEHSHLDRIRRLKLRNSEYVVIGGAVLEILGIRETNDVDLVVSKAVYRRLHDHSWDEFIQDDGKKILSHHGYKVMLNWMGKDLSDLRPASFQYQGASLMGLEDLVECKIQLGRKKDLEDVIRIKQYEVAAVRKGRVQGIPAAA